MTSAQRCWMSLLLVATAGPLWPTHPCMAQSFKTHFDEGHIFSSGQDILFGIESIDNAGDAYVVSYNHVNVNTIHSVHGMPQTITLKGMPTGIYWLAETDGRVLDSFAVLPPPERTVGSEASPFGVFHAYVDKRNAGLARVDTLLDTIHAAGIGWVRSTTFFTPDKEAFDWTDRDRFVDAINRHDLQLLSMFESMNFPEAWKPLWENPLSFLPLPMECGYDCFRIYEHSGPSYYQETNMGNGKWTSERFNRYLRANAYRRVPGQKCGYLLQYGNRQIFLVSSK